MKRRTVFIEVREKEVVEQQDITAFIWAYKQAVLHAVKEQGNLNEMQLLYCMEKLEASKGRSESIYPRRVNRCTTRQK